MGSDKRERRPKRSVDEDTKGEIIQTYLEEGAFATEKKYNKGKVLGLGRNSSS